MNVFSAFNDVSDKASSLGEDYIKTSHQYFKLKTFQQLSFSISLLIKLFAIGTVLIITFLFLAISASIALGNYLNSLALGYLITATITLLIAILIFFYRKHIDQYVIKKLSKQFFN